MKSVRMQALRAAVAVCAIQLAGCSALDWMNPFSSSEPKLPELAPVKATVQTTTAWRASVPAGGDYALAPARVGSTVYAAGRDGTLVRLDGGRQAWKINVGAVISGGVGADERFVVVGTPKGDVLVFDTNGKPVWKARVTSEVLAPATLAENVIIVRTSDSRVHGLDVQDGKRKWLYQRATPSLTLRSGGAMTLLEKSVLAGFAGGKLLAISLANGGPLWEVTVSLPRGATELERIADVTSAPTLGPKQICAAAYQGRLGCYDPSSGNALWTRDISSGVGMSTDGRTVYVSDEKSAIHALDINTGASLWKQDKLQMRGITRPLVVGNHVVVADSKGLVHVLRRTDGEFEARFSVGSAPVRTDLVRLGDNSFLVQNASGDLTAIELQ